MNYEIDEYFKDANELENRYYNLLSRLSSLMAYLDQHLGLRFENGYLQDFSITKDNDLRLTFTSNSCGNYESKNYYLPRYAVDFADQYIEEVLTTRKAAEEEKERERENAKRLNEIRLKKQEKANLERLLELSKTGYFDEA